MGKFRDWLKSTPEDRRERYEQAEAQRKAKYAARMAEIEAQLTANKAQLNEARAAEADRRRERKERQSPKPVRARSGKVAPRSARTTRLVMVKFSRDPSAPIPSADSSGGYVYKWDIPGDPRPGDWVVVPGSSGLALAVVFREGTPQDARGHALQTVARLASASEIQQLANQHDQERKRQRSEIEQWLRIAKAVAEGGRAQPAPEHLPDIPPTDGHATATAAKGYGRVWYRAYKTAEEYGWPIADVQLFKQIATRWYSISRGAM